MIKEQENKEGRRFCTPTLFLFVRFFLGEAYALEGGCEESVVYYVF